MRHVERAEKRRRHFVLPPHCTNHDAIHGLRWQSEPGERRHRFGCRTHQEAVLQLAFTERTPSSFVRCMSAGCPISVRSRAKTDRTTSAAPLDMLAMKKQGARLM